MTHSALPEADGRVAIRLNEDGSGPVAGYVEKLHEGEWAIEGDKVAKFTSAEDAAEEVVKRYENSQALADFVGTPTPQN